MCCGLGIRFNTLNSQCCITSMAILRFIAAFSLILGMTACSVTKKGGTSDSNEAVSKLRLNIANTAEDYLGTPYKYAGQKPSTGFDCSGFTSYVMKQYKVNLSPASAEQAKQGKQVALDQAKPADLVFFSEDGRKISHVAMVVTNSKRGLVCIHSTTSRGVIMENITTSKYWNPKIKFARNVLDR